MSSALATLSPLIPQTPSKASTLISCVPTIKAVDLHSLNDLESGTIYPLSCPRCDEHLTVAVGSSCGCIGRVMKPPALNAAEGAVLALASKGVLANRRHRRHNQPRAPVPTLPPLGSLEEQTARVFRQNSEILLDPMAPLSPLCPLPSPAPVSASCPASLPVCADKASNDDLSRTLDEVMFLYETEAGSAFPSSPTSEYSSSPPPSPSPLSSSPSSMDSLQAQLDKVITSHRRARDVVEEFLGEVRGLEEEMLEGWRKEDKVKTATETMRDIKAKTTAPREKISMLGGFETMGVLSPAKLLRRP
ncbi:MAG: hypothetical protein Q9160_005241 [Pyrenula sp. 1 TL-2023]